MITPEHEYVHAYFTDDNRTTIEAYWQHPESEDKMSAEVEFIEAKEGDSSYEHLLQFVTIDQIHENTFKHIKEQKQIMDEAILTVGKAQGMIYDVDNVNTKMYEALIKTLFNFNPEAEGAKETLFLYKLAVFENETINASKDRELKSKIRKAPTIMEATKYAIELYEAAGSETTSPESSDTQIAD